MFPKFKRVHRLAWWARRAKKKYSRNEIIKALDAVWTDQRIRETGKLPIGDWSECELTETPDWEVQLIDRLRIILIAETLSSIRHKLGIDRDRDGVSMD